MDVEAISFSRKLRDPIHGYVPFTNIENRVIDSHAFQRLSHVSQMHSAHLVYPGAQYSRKIHSFGVMHLAHRMVTRLLYNQMPGGMATPALLFLDSPEKIPGLEPLKLEEGFRKLGVTLAGRDLGLYTIQAIRLAGLLHDIGHGPFSHLFEHVSGRKFNHEAKGIQIVKRLATDKDGGPFLEAIDADIVSAILSKELPRELKFLGQIISSPLDADKIDYLLRDSHYAGTPEYGTLDVDRILDSLLVRNGNMCYSSDGLDALVSALNSMFFMYSNVYLHRTARAFDIMLDEGLSPLSEYWGSFMADEMTDSFLTLDEHTLVSRLEEEGRKRSGEERTRFVVAAETLGYVRRRKKKYRAVVDQRIGLPVKVAYGDDVYNQQIDRIKERLEEPAKAFKVATSVEVTLDLQRNVRPIGLKLAELGGFLDTEAIFDRFSGTMLRFRDYSPHYKTLTRVVVPIRLFAEVAKVDAVPPKDFERAKARLNLDVREQVRMHQATLVKLLLGDLAADLDLG